MTTEISTTQGMTTEQVALLARTIAKDATPDELALFVGMCKRTQLDPFTRQIYFIKSNGRVMTQISIDGFRVIAERSGNYAGQDAPQFTEDMNGKVVSCSVAVYRWHGETRYQASVGVAYMAEYAKGSGTWTQLPRTMISKVAECIALRKAFPNDLSGLYAPEEMDQATKEDTVTHDTTPQSPMTPPPGIIEAKKKEPVSAQAFPATEKTPDFLEPKPPAPPIIEVTANGNPKGTITEDQTKKLYAVLNEMGADAEKANDYAVEKFGCRLSGLSKEQAIVLIDALERKIAMTKKTAETVTMTTDEVVAALGGEESGSALMREAMEKGRMAQRAKMGNL